MTDLKWTALRHRMLTQVADSLPGERTLALVCVNQKRAVWRPVRLDLDIEQKLSAGESRAVSDLWGAGLIVTPFWQGDMDVYRVLVIAGPGQVVLDRWDEVADTPNQGGGGA